MATRPAADTRELLLSAAAGAFAQRGYHQATVKDIVTRAGVATGTFYLYFPTKESSCLALIDRLYDTMITAVAEARSGYGTVLEKLAASIRVALSVFGEYPDSAKLVLIQAPGAHPDFDRRLREIHSNLLTLLQQDLKEAVEAGLIPRQQPDVVARCLVGSLYEVLIGWIRDGSPTHPRAAAEALVAFTLRGIGAAVPTPPVG